MSGFPFRLAVFDLDGTLLGPDKEVSADNAAAVAQLRGLGCAIVLASGRPHANVLRFHRQLDLTGAIVSGNGALVKVAETEEIWGAWFLERRLAEALLTLGAEWDVTQIWDGVDGVFTWHQTAWSEVLAERTKSPVLPIGDPRLHFPEQAPFKIVWIDAPERIARFEGELRQRFGDETYITVTDPEYLEVAHPAVNKAAALAIVAQKHGIRPDEVIVFGDGDNDAEMLAWAGLGVAMPHSRPKALAAADRLGPDVAPERAVAAAVADVLAAFCDPH